jgi:hypothetical protein
MLASHVRIARAIRGWYTIPASILVVSTGRIDHLLNVAGKEEQELSALRENLQAA